MLAEIGPTEPNPDCGPCNVFQRPERCDCILDELANSPPLDHHQLNPSRRCACKLGDLAHDLPLGHHRLLKLTKEMQTIYSEISSLCSLHADGTKAQHGIPALVVRTCQKLRNEDRQALVTAHKIY